MFRRHRLKKHSLNFSCFALVCLSLGLGLGACKKSGVPGAQDSLSRAGVIRIGEVGSMTGSDATFGISTHRGITLALDEVNEAGGVEGRKIELVTLDDQGKASEAILAMNKLIFQEKVMAVVGEVASSLSIAMAPIAQKSKIPMISPSSINSKLTRQGEYIFRVCFVDSFQSQVMAKFALENLKAKTAAILRDVKSDYSQDSAKIFIDLFKKRGGQIVMDQSYSAGEIDFKSQLTAIRSVNPDVILVPGYYTEIGLIARQARELGIKAPLLGGDGWDSPRLTEIAGASLQGSYFVSHFAKDDTSPRVQKFVQRYKKSFGEIPDGLAALGYDAAMVLVDGLKRAKSLTSTELREALADTHGFAGVTGSISINSERNAVKPAVVFQVGEGGKIQIAATVAE